VLIGSDRTGFIGATPQPTYHLLVQNQNASMLTRYFWNNHIDNIWDYHQIRGQTFWKFHLKTNNLEYNDVTNTNTRPVVSIHSMYFVFPFGPRACGIIVIPISKRNWETKATLFSDFSKFLPLRVKPEEDITNPKEFMWEFINIKFTLGNLILQSKSSLLDRGLAEFIFPNTTFLGANTYETCRCCELRLVWDSSPGGTEYFKTINIRHQPELTMRHDGASLLITYKDEFTFLSCGDTYKDSLNFLAFFMPFTKTTWTLIFLTIFGWPLVLSLIENDFKLKNVLKDFDALFIGWAMILEQSHLRATNYKGRGPLYCYCGCVLLAILVLSNAYKGDNIQTLTKAFEMVPLEHMNQVIQAGYMTYTRQYCYKDVPGYAKATICLDDFDKESSGREDQYTDEQFKLWKPMGLQLMKDDDTHVDVDFFGKCRNKKALLGWRSILEPLQNQLRKKQAKANVYIGQEFLFTRHLGWQLNRYGSIKVLKRMWTLVESGVHNELLNISHRPPAAPALKPRQLTIHGNISVQFVFHSCGVLFAFLVFAIEFHKSIALYFNSFCLISSFFIKNFLHQFQKALVHGLRLVLSKKNEFFSFSLSSLPLNCIVIEHESLRKPYILQGMTTHAE